VTGLALAGVEDALLTFVADVRSLVATVQVAASRRLDAADALFTEADTQTGRDRVATLQSAAKALLGDDAVVVPEFTVDAGRATAFGQALTASRNGEIFTYLAPTLDFPVDTWLHGVARVRDKAAAWEQTQLLAGALAGAEPALEALQLPYVAGERWLGLEFPPTPVVDSERLLYTAHLPAGFTPAAPQRGLLLDEWSEIIPGTDVQTGVTLHHDRPNTEAPQSMLLLTPSQFRGGWQWADIVDALNETLDLAKLRAVEPKHLDTLPYAWFLPATMMATQARQLTISVDLALNHHLNLVQGA
jgi:hypothetical protein